MTTGPTTAPTPELAAIEARVKSRPLPRHVGIIMDGNGRWAEGKGKSRVEGHREGSASVREVTRCARRVGVRALTLYAFSAQNWARPDEEVAALMQLLFEFLETERAEILDNQIRLSAIGDLAKLPEPVRERLDDVIDASAKNGGMVLTLALSYGGREELVRAARNAAAKVSRPEEIDAARFAAELYTSDLPELDLVIRTSGEKRISNFLLWQCAYAELAFVETLWPDFRDAAFLQCLEEFQGRQRRFGLTGAQVQGQGSAR